MGKLPYGPGSQHIKQSYGADTDPLKHYCTQYGTKYGQHFSKFEPRSGRHTGTGYQSNFRPGVYYSAKLDQLDNPAMGAIVSDNYASVTQKSFRPYTTQTGKEPLPFSTVQTGSGFIRTKNLNVPTSGEGPRYMSTETGEKFHGNQRSATGPNVCFKTEGGSGFTHAYNVEPITFYPDKAHRNEAPGWVTDRPTGYSIHASDYRPLRVPHGDEPLPNLANRSVRDTGFTSGTRARPGFVHRVMGDAYDKAGDIPEARLDRTKKQDPAEYLNMTNPDNYSSVYKKTYLGQRLEPSEAERIGNQGIGDKEKSGFSSNHDTYLHSQDNPARFITHYQTRYLDKTPVGTDRQGHVWGGVQRPLPDGYTRSTGVHARGEEYDSTATRRGMEPYVGRSTIARDPFFDEHKYDSKIHKPQSMACI